MNIIYLLGNSGKDPQVKTTDNGLKVATFSLATSENYKVGDEWKEITDWHNIVAWRHLAEKVEKYVKKGSHVLVVGKVRTREYEKDGQKRYITEVLATQINVFDRIEKQGAASEYLEAVNDVSENDGLPF